MKFKYTGNCKGMIFRGLNFPIDKTVEVEDKEAIDKLKGNSHFSEVKSRNTKNGNSGGNQE